MTKISEVIKRLEELKMEHGDVDVIVYDCFNRAKDKKVYELDQKKILYDEFFKDVFIGV